jgi:hypothetical protein
MVPIVISWSCRVPCAAAVAAGEGSSLVASEGADVRREMPMPAGTMRALENETAE